MDAIKLRAIVDENCLLRWNIQQVGGTLNVCSGIVLSSILLAFYKLFALFVALQLHSNTSSLATYTSAMTTGLFVFWSGLGLRYLEAFFGMLITLMCVMFGWMVSARGGKNILERSM